LKHVTLFVIYSQVRKAELSTRNCLRYLLTDTCWCIYCI